MLGLVRRVLVCTCLLWWLGPGGSLAQASSGGAGFAAPSAGQRFAVGEIVVRYSDPRRRRTLTTLIRYPAAGNPSRGDILAATPAKPAGPFPLIVFGHGYNITPAPYAPLLRAWARAGYVVAAPIFPYSNPYAPGGPSQGDLVNQPGDMSFVITRVLAGDARSHGILSRLVNRHQVAVTGQSDGGSTALAAAYNSHYRDRRIGAAMILSGARIPRVGGYDFAPGTPPLLAVQGTADTVNSPSSTYNYFSLARPPKFLLSLLGASHLPPYTSQQPQLGIVERVTIAFLDRYLKHAPGAKARMWRAGNVPHVATLGT
jgi:dienelactone hydrolase